MGRSLPWVLTLAGLGGCTPDPCLPVRQVPIYGDAVATDEMLEQVREVMDTFSDWTEDDDVCLTEVRFEAGMEDQGHEILGQYSGGSFQTITIEVDEPDLVPEIARHELCHALDASLGLSAAHPELFAFADDDLSPALYPTPEDVAGEHFADACETGPPLREWNEAVEELGSPRVDSLHFWLDEVYPDYTEPVGLSAGPAWTARRVTAPRLVAGSVETSAWAVPTPGGFFVNVQPLEPGEGAGRPERYSQYHVATDSWSPVRVPGPDVDGAQPMSNSLGTDLYLLAQSDSEAARHLDRLHGDDVIPVDDAWDDGLTSDRVTWSFDDDRVAWQQWGDGRPVQARTLFPLGDQHPLAASGGWAIDPPTIRLPEGDVGFAWEPHEGWPIPLLYDGVNVVPAAVPRGVWPRGTMGDGTSFATTALESASGVWNDAVLYRSLDGPWQLGWIHEDVGGEHTLGPAPEPLWDALSLVDGHLYRLRLTSRGPRLDELLPPE